jgi:hypothetical protein
MARFGPLEWSCAAASLACLALGGRELLADYRFKAGARAVDVEVVAVLHVPDPGFWKYEVKGNDQGRALTWTLPGVERSRTGTPRPGNRVGDRLRVLYNPAEQPQARWEGHAWDSSLIFLILGGGLALTAIGMSFLNRSAPARPVSQPRPKAPRQDARKP